MNFDTLEQLVNRCLILVKRRKVFDAPLAELAVQPGLRQQYFGI